MQLRASITAWLWALVLLPTVPLLGAIAYSASQYTEEQERALEARLLEQADELANRAQARIEQAAGALTALSQSNAAIEGNVTRLYAASQRVHAALPILSAISLVDAQGRLVFLTLSPLAAKLPTGHVESVCEAFATGRHSLSKPFPSPVDQRIVIALNVPVMRDSRIAYCLRGILRIETLSELIRPQSLEPGWIAGIFDHDGIAVARSLSPELFVGKPAGPDLLKAIRSGNRSAWRGHTREGIDTLSVSRPLEPWGWTVALAVPIETLVAPVRRETARLAGLAAAVLLLLALTVARLNRYITRQLAAVAADAESAIIGGGSPTVSTGIHELDGLRASLTRARPSAIRAVACGRGAGPAG